MGKRCPSEDQSKILINKAGLSHSISTENRNVRFYLHQTIIFRAHTPALSDSSPLSPSAYRPDRMCEGKLRALHFQLGIHAALF